MRKRAQEIRAAIRLSVQLVHRRPTSADHGVLIAFALFLSAPSHPANIGAAARAIKTMGFARLVIVNPRLPDYREIRSGLRFDRRHGVLRRASRTHAGASPDGCHDGVLDDRL